MTKIGADPNPEGPVRLRFAEHPDELLASVEANLRGLGLDQLPVVLLRRADVGPGMKARADQVVDLDDQLETMIALRDQGKIGAFGIGSVGAEALRRAIPSGIVFVQNAYSLVSREDEAMLELAAAADIAWIPFFPLGGAFAGFPKVIEQPAVVAAAKRFGARPRRSDSLGYSTTTLTSCSSREQPTSPISAPMSPPAPSSSTSPR